MGKAKKKTSIWIFLLLIVIGALAFSSIALYKLYKQQIALEKAEASVYAAFGVDIPSGYSIHGIDVSSYQNIIYWPSVKAMNINNININFAFIKATEGLNDCDKMFAKNWEATKQQGITHGAYHFFLATKSGNKQATNFINNVTLDEGDLPPVVDVEQLYNVPPKLMKLRLKECLDSLEKHYKTKPILYTFVDFYEHNLGKDFDMYPLWIAHYNEPEKPRIKRDWIFWQHSQEAHVNGITTFIDFNVFNGDSLAFQNILVK